MNMFAFLVPGPIQLLIIGGIILLLFGNRMPGAMRSLGRSVVEFKKGISDIEDEVNSAVKNTNETTKTKDNTE